MNHTDYLARYDQFMGILKGDAQTLLALCDCWLDPAYVISPDGYYETDFYEAQGEWETLRAARQLWPTLYAHMNWMAWETVNARQFEGTVCSWLNEHIPSAIFSLEEMAFGIPMQFLGWDDEPDVPGVAFLQQLMKATSGYTEGFLVQGYEQSCPEIAALLNWVFKRSGNSSFDYSWDDAAECITDRLEWDAGDLDFAWLIHLEAWEMDRLKDQGLMLIENSTFFEDVIDSAMIAISLEAGRRLYDHRERHLEFKRPGNRQTGRRRQTADDHSVLQLRNCDAA